jgi:hypothetical protein
MGRVDNREAASHDLIVLRSKSRRDFNHSAQRCDEGATLGWRFRRFIYPERVESKSGTQHDHAVLLKRGTYELARDGFEFPFELRQKNDSIKPSRCGRRVGERRSLARGSNIRPERSPVCAVRCRLVLDAVQPVCKRIPTYDRIAPGSFGHANDGSWNNPEKSAFFPGQSINVAVPSSN